MNGIELLPPFLLISNTFVMDILKHIKLTPPICISIDKRLPPEDGHLKTEMHITDILPQSSK